MLIRIHVIPNAKEARVVKVGDDSLEVRLDERAVNGRAQQETSGRLYPNISLFQNLEFSLRKK